jgi:hypothetical protein
MATAFETALSSAQTSILGMVDDFIPVVAAVGVAFIGVKYLRRFLRSA